MLAQIRLLRMKLPDARRRLDRQTPPHFLFLWTKQTMGVHQHPNSGWSKLKEWGPTVAGGIGMIKTGLDVGRAVYGVASAAAPYVLPAMAALAPVGL